MAPKTTEGATHPHLAAHPTGPIPSIPNIPFVEFHVVFVQQFTVLLLERARAMMFLLVVYVELNRLNQPAQPYEAGRWPATAKRAMNPGRYPGVTLGWYEAGRWPEGKGVHARTHWAAGLGGVYTWLRIYKRGSNAPILQLSKNSVVRRAPFVSHRNS
jgi:hypothetical protein